MTHICVGKLTTIGSEDGLSPGRRQAIIWTNAGILLIWPLGTNFNEILIEIYIFSFKKTHLKTSSVKWRPFCLGLNMLTTGKIYPFLRFSTLQRWPLGCPGHLGLCNPSYYSTRVNEHFYDNPSHHGTGSRIISNQLKPMDDWPLLTHPC